MDPVVGPLVGAALGGLATLAATRLLARRARRVDGAPVAPAAVGPDAPSAPDRPASDGCERAGPAEGHPSDAASAADARGESAALAAERARLEGVAADLETRTQALRRRLDAVAGPDAGAERARALAVLDDELASERARRVLRAVDAAREEADARARAIVCTAIQRVAVSHVAERTVSTVAIDDAWKGRLIGREGRNVRALERRTGCDVLVDDTPGVVTISGFDPVRREVARRAIAALLADGRIHPERIDEAVGAAARETEADIVDAGRRALAACDVADAHPRLVACLGRLSYRTSYGQNVLAHSVEVAGLAGALAAELGLDARTAKRVGLFHDLGKAVDHEEEGSHAVIGARILEACGERALVVNAVASHHEDVAQESLYAIVAQSADAISAARPGARSDGAERHARRLADLERVAASFEGVSEAFAVKAGREIRVVVDAKRVTDAAAVLLAREIARAVEAELAYPGEIRVTVLRETEAVEYAR